MGTATLLTGSQPGNQAGELSPLVKTLPLSLKIYIQSLGPTAQALRGSICPQMVPKCFPSSLPALRLAVFPWVADPGADCLDFLAYLHVPFCFSCPGLSRRRAIGSCGFLRPLPPFLGGPFPVCESVLDHQAPLPLQPGTEGSNNRSKICRCPVST